MPTSAPARPNISAIALPTPRDPPVTIAFLPEKSILSIRVFSGQVLLMRALDIEKPANHRCRLRVELQCEYRFIPRDLFALANAGDVVPILVDRFAVHVLIIEGRQLFT